MKHLLCTISIVLVLFSCNKEENSIHSESMQVIEISSEFDWKSTRTLSINISSQHSQIIEIQSPYDQTVFIKYYYKPSMEVKTLELNIPRYYNQLLINNTSLKLPNGEDLVELKLDTLKSSLTNKGYLTLTNDIISHWNFNEGVGNIVEDSKGENHGEMYNATWVNGVNLSALAFNGENSNVIIPNSPGLNISNELTLMAWVKFLENEDAVIIQKGEISSYGFSFEKWNGWKSQIILASGDSISMLWGEGLPLENEWHHLTLTCDGSNARLYVNGYLFAENPYSGLISTNSGDLIFGSNGDLTKAFNGALDDVILFNRSFSEEEVQDYYYSINGPDKDGDGIPNDKDDHPEDKYKAFDNLWPSINYGTLMFEDSWPQSDDYDFNDVVIDFKINTICNQNNKISEIQFEFLLNNHSSNNSHGFGFQIENNSFEKNDMFIEGSYINSNYINLNSQGLEENQEKPVIIVYDDDSYVTDSLVKIRMILPANKYSISDFSINNFNPFVFIYNNRGIEFHTPHFPPTDLVNKETFNKANDISNSYYMDSKNRPWAIMIPQKTNAVLEGVDITKAYLNFYEWASSGGLYYSDWYQNTEGNTNQSYIQTDN